LSQISSFCQTLRTGLQSSSLPIVTVFLILLISAYYFVKVCQGYALEILLIIFYAFLNESYIFCCCFVLFFQPSKRHSFNRTLRHFLLHGSSYLESITVPLHPRVFSSKCLELSKTASLPESVVQNHNETNKYINIHNLSSILPINKIILIDFRGTILFICVLFWFFFFMMELCCHYHTEVIFVLVLIISCI